MASGNYYIVYAGVASLHTLPPAEACESVMGFLEQRHCTDIAGFSLLGEGVCSLCPFQEGETIRKPACGFLQTSLVSFPIIQAVCP